MLKILLADVSSPQVPELYPESGQRGLGPFRKSDLKVYVVDIFVGVFLLRLFRV